MSCAAVYKDFDVVQPQTFTASRSDYGCRQVLGGRRVEAVDVPPFTHAEHVGGFERDSSAGRKDRSADVVGAWSRGVYDSLPGVRPDCMEGCFSRCLSRMD